MKTIALLTFIAVYALFTAQKYRAVIRLSAAALFCSCGSCR